MPAEILKGTELSEFHSAANVKTGLKLLLAGFHGLNISVLGQPDSPNLPVLIPPAHLATSFFFPLLRIVRETYRSRQPFTRALRRSRHSGGSRD